MFYLLIEMLAILGILVTWVYMRLDPHMRFRDVRYLLGLGFGFVLLFAASNAVPPEFSLPSASLVFTFMGLLLWISWKMPLRR